MHTEWHSRALCQADQTLALLRALAGLLAWAAAATAVAAALLAGLRHSVHALVARACEFGRPARVSVGAGRPLMPLPVANHCQAGCGPGALRCTWARRLACLHGQRGVAQGGCAAGKMPHCQQTLSFGCLNTHCSPACAPAAVLLLPPRPLGDVPLCRMGAACPCSHSSHISTAMCQ